ncbi:rha-1 [Symbiodinium sp. CCMP2592]|nr:rha-1 [Symbiodinium sp. CCMP2592]
MRGRAFGTGTSHPSVPPRRPAPPPSAPSPLPQSPISSTPPAGSGKTPVPTYLRAALHREVASHAAAQRPQAIFETLWRYVDRFQPELMDLDACLHSLVKCNTESWSWQKFARKARGKVVIRTEDLVRLLSHLERELLHEHGNGSDITRSLATSAWALASLSRWQPAVSREALQQMRPIFTLIEDLAKPLFPSFALNNLSMLAWGFARSGLGTKELFDSFGHAALVRQHQLSARDLANLTWSFAAAKLSHELLKQVPALVLEDSRGVAAFEEQDLSTLAWGLATLRLREEELLQALGEEARVKLASFTVPGLICTTWAFASLRVKAPFVREALDQLRHSGRLEPRGCSMMLWSLASLRHDDRSELFYYSMADMVILPRARDFEAQDVSNCLWAFATARVQHEAVFQALVSQAMQSIHRFTSQALANTTWASAKMHAREAKAMVAVAADEALRRPQRTWSSQGLVTLCWASAEVQVAPVRLLTSVTEELHSRPNAFNDVDLATLVFTLKEELWQEHQHIRQACLLRIRAETARRHLPATSAMLRAPPHGRSVPSMPDPAKKSLTRVWRIACISLANRVASCIKDLVAVPMR